ncbi:MAG: hypothetical protein WCO94_04460 [Verrucomicrobiota bacterium]
MNTAISMPLAIILGAVLIAAAIYLKPASGYQAIYGDGYVYVIDLRKKNIANIVPGKSVHP